MSKEMVPRDIAVPPVGGEYSDEEFQGIRGKTGSLMTKVMRWPRSVGK